MNLELLQGVKLRSSLQCQTEFLIERRHFVQKGHFHKDMNSFDMEFVFNIENAINLKLIITRILLQSSIFILTLFLLQVNNNNVSWREFLCHWPLWSIYIAHFSMNWSNYIIMQWLPTYMTRTLGAEKSHIMFTAVPYIMNSLVGMGEISLLSTLTKYRRLMLKISLFMMRFSLYYNLIIK